VPTRGISENIHRATLVLGPSAEIGCAEGSQWDCREREYGSADESGARMGRRQELWM